MRKLILLGIAAALAVSLWGRNGSPAPNPTALSRGPNPTALSRARSARVEGPTPALSRAPIPIALSSARSAQVEGPTEQTYQFVVMDQSGTRVPSKLLWRHDGGDFEAIAQSDGERPLALSVEGPLPSQAFIQANYYSPSIRLTPSDWHRAAEGEAMIVLPRQSSVRVLIDGDEPVDEVVYAKRLDDSPEDSNESSMIGSLLLGPGQYLVFATGAGDQTLIASTLIAVDPNTDSTVNLLRQSRSSFEATITDASGRPVPDTMLTITSDLVRGDWWQGSTDAAGRVRVPVMPGSRYELTLNLAGDDIVTGSFRAGERRTVRLARHVISCRFAGGEGFSTSSVLVEGESGGYGFGMLGGSNSEDKVYRFAWPEKARAVEVELSTDGHEGKLRLTSPHHSCILDAKPRQMVR